MHLEKLMEMAVIQINSPWFAPNFVCFLEVALARFDKHLMERAVLSKCWRREHVTRLPSNVVVPLTANVQMLPCSHTIFWPHVVYSQCTPDSHFLLLTCPVYFKVALSVLQMHLMTDTGRACCTHFILNELYVSRVRVYISADLSVPTAVHCFRKTNPSVLRKCWSM